MSFVIPLNELHKEDTPTVGGKNAMLGELMMMTKHLSQQIIIPPGFAITTAAFEQWLGWSKLTDERITNTLQTIGRDIPRIQEAANMIYNHMKVIQMPKLDIYKELDKSKLYAVRSSGIDEDGDASSFAGQHDSFLNVPANEVTGRVKDVWLSSYNHRALYYRSVKGILDKPIRQGVVIQEMVPNLKWAGVAFSADPRTGRTDMGLIEYIDGLGEDLVSGKKTPILVPFDHNKEIFPATWVNPLVFPLVKTTIELFQALGYPVDIEWAWNGCLNLLQARPITNLLTPLSDDQVKKLATSNDKLGTAILVGTGLAPGSVKALGFISRKQAIAMLEHGEYNGRYMDLSKRILLVPFTTPDDLPIMEKVAGIVVSKGGHTSHEIGR